MNQTGDIAELSMALAATKQGFAVYLPYGHQTKVDMIIQKPGGKPVMIQVKKGTLQSKNKPHHASSWKTLIGSCKSSSSTCSGPRLKRYKNNDFDVLALYIQELNLFGFYELSKISGRSSMRWNEGKSRRNNWQLFDKYQYKNK